VSRYLPDEREAILARSRAFLAGEELQQSKVQNAPSSDVPADDDGGAAEDAKPWWEWVQKHCDFRDRVMQEAVGECLAHFQKEARDHCDRECTLMNRELAITRKELESAGDARALASKERHDAMARELAATKRELELLKQEFVILREQVGLAKGLRSLRTEVEDARAQMPQIPATVSRLQAAQMHLEREVDKTKNRLAKARVDQSMTTYQLGELRKELDAKVKAATAAVELKLEQTTSFEMRALHPDAAAALKQFAQEVIDGTIVH
jgi:chromosome segregation ATPase